MVQARYDRIGGNYSTFRRPEPAWEAELLDVLGDAERLLNIGAGAGGYEPADRQVVALEPSKVMLGQRGSTAAPAVRGVAEALPFPDDSFDVAYGVLTMHHWSDRRAGLGEAGRVAPRQCFTVYDRAMTSDFWLIDYFPEAVESPMERNAPMPADVDEVLRVVEVRTLWVPRDCQAGFTTASWARPHDYLDPDMQQAMSTLAMLPPHVLARGTEHLRRDLDSGRWAERNGALADQDRADFGYRLVVAERR